MSSLGLWEGHIKVVASKFGTDVTAYFLFLRWLFVANALIGGLFHWQIHRADSEPCWYPRLDLSLPGLLVLLFVFVPQMFYQGIHENHPWASGQSNSGSAFLTGKVSFSLCFSLPLTET